MEENKNPVICIHCSHRIGGGLPTNGSVRCSLYQDNAPFDRVTGYRTKRASVSARRERSWLWWLLTFGRTCGPAGKHYKSLIK